MYLLDVFPAGPGGGNPAPIVVDAERMTDDDMRAVARSHGHESGFVLPASPGSSEIELRFLLRDGRADGVWLGCGVRATR